MSEEDCTVLCVWGSKLRKLTIKLPAVRVQLVYKTFGERGSWRRRGGGKEGRRERGMKAICARGKQAESPVRGKFTLVWCGGEVEERRDQSCWGQSPRTGAAVPERAVCAAGAWENKKKTEHWPSEGRSKGWRRWVKRMPLWKLLKENRYSW